MRQTLSFIATAAFVASLGVAAHAAPALDAKGRRQREVPRHQDEEVCEMWCAGHRARAEEVAAGGRLATIPSSPQIEGPMLKQPHLNPTTTDLLARISALIGGGRMPTGLAMAPETWDRLAAEPDQRDCAEADGRRTFHSIPVHLVEDCLGVAIGFEKHDG
jgi:hypothetical protein